MAFKSGIACHREVYELGAGQLPGPPLRMATNNVRPSEPSGWPFGTTEHSGNEYRTKSGKFFVDPPPLDDEDPSSLLPLRCR